MTTLKKFRWFWAWDDEKEETWLRGMAQQGWHLKSLSLPGRYTFEQGAPRDEVYRLDFFTGGKDKDDYLLLFQDSGWEHLGAMNSWQYFRKAAADGEAPDIFSDRESKAGKYQRIILILTLLLPLSTLSAVILGQREEEFSKVLGVIWAAGMIFYAYAMIRLLMRITRLKRKF